jgi:protein AroM
MRVGLLTIGQSPRIDILEELRELLPKDVEVVEAGALDDFDEGYIRANLAPAEGDVTYVTRLRTGVEVRVSRSKLIPLLQRKVDYLNSVGVDLIAILCTGEFPEFSSRVPVVYPDKALKGLASSLRLRGPVGVLIPDQAQVGYARSKWGEFFSEVIVHPVSPYTATTEDFVRAAERLSSSNVSIVIMDCMGYTLKQRDIVRKTVRKPVIASRTVLARVLTELLT